MKLGILSSTREECGENKPLLGVITLFADRELLDASNGRTMRRFIAELLPPPLPRTLIFLPLRYNVGLHLSSLSVQRCKIALSLLQRTCRPIHFILSDTSLIKIPLHTLASVVFDEVNSRRNCLLVVHV